MIFKTVNDFFKIFIITVSGNNRRRYDNIILAPGIYAAQSIAFKVLCVRIYDYLFPVFKYVYKSVLTLLFIILYAEPCIVRTHNIVCIKCCDNKLPLTVSSIGIVIYPVNSLLTENKIFVIALLCLRQTLDYFTAS